MKKEILAIIITLCLVSTTTALARGYNHGGSGNRHGHHEIRHDNGLGLAVGIAGGLLLGSALFVAAAPPPRQVIYGYPHYQPEVIVRQPSICIENRVVTGEWQINRYDGRQIWVPYPYAVHRRVEVPCY